MSSLQDKTLTCRDCGRQFTFSAGEQEYYAQRGFTEPSRCKDCRAARKTARDGEEGGMRARGGFTADRGPRQMYPAICARCGKQTEVPFQPRGDRPVYCSDCYQAQRGGSSYGGGRSSNREGDRRSTNRRERW